MKKILNFQQGDAMFISGILVFGSIYGLWSSNFVSEGPKEIKFETETSAIASSRVDLLEYNKKEIAQGKILKTQGFSNSIWGEYKKGYVILEKVKYEDLNKNDFVVYKNSENLINHRLRVETKEGWIAEGDGNRTHDSILVTKDNLVGRVLNKVFYRY